ncbi:MAG: family 2 glycosyl transferase [Gemmatimonadetes bacterium]|nr:family 2 glycosyl transferase [Gemmatimonadota bacterium]|tara:strand:+ start:2311 stop:3030 length:720 start_codon:yes stop_codon:yes gene_type:complete
MTLIVVPCYNEAGRLDPDAFAQVQTPCLLVDDGSTDRTREVIDRICEDGRHRQLILTTNVGKAEAVRQGLLTAIHDGATRVGYWDADLATPFEEIPRFNAILDRDERIDLVLGARINLLGREIHRSSSRHYVGRIFATAVSAVLGLPVYDTQCGAKLFQVSEDLRTILAEPFISRWIFDVELLARWITLPVGDVSRADQIYELPLRTWQDVSGSKLHPVDLLKAPFELLRIHARYFGSP